MFAVRILGKTVNFYSPVMLADIVKEYSTKFAVAAAVDGRLCELTKVVDTDCNILPIGLDAEEGMRIYLRTLKYVLIMAAGRCFHRASVEFMYSLSKGQYFEIKGITATDDTASRLSREMSLIIKNNIPITRIRLEKQEAAAIYEKVYPDKAKLLAYRPENTVNAYKCSNEVNYLYGYMMPSTGYLRDYELHRSKNGFVLLYPRSDISGRLPIYEETTKFRQVMQEAEAFGRRTGVYDISTLNRVIEKGEIKQFALMCEQRQNNEIAKAAEKIYTDAKIKVVLIAGPSSSGKTTFSDKLTETLQLHGKNIVQISTDDYFKDRSEYPLDENGKPDYESIECINIEKFNSDLLALTNGETVTLSAFDFMEHKSVEGRQVRLLPDDIIVIEGIHGLNDKLTYMIKPENKFRIYISALTHINIDNQTPVSTTTCRLIRRIVRDDRTRGTGIEETFDMWASVRKGEFRWIYPFQEKADFIFNSELTYELPVLKKHIMPLVERIDRKSKHFITANKITKILKYVLDADDDIVPADSILREFIGK